MLAELEAFAAGRRRRAADGQAGPPRQLGRHDPRARAAERCAALDEAFRFDDLALVERYLAGARDLEVAVIGNEPDEIELYGPGEILSGHEFYDYAAKYTPGLSETTIQRRGHAVERAAMLKLARDAYRAIGGEGFARIDFLLAGETLVVSEINTIPGFTPISLFPTLSGRRRLRLRRGLPPRRGPRPRARRRPASATA